MRVLAISTSFAHHGTESGYKQILKYIKPVCLLGINELASSKQNLIFNKYPFLYEFVAYFKRTKADVLHILYGENYFRFSAVLFRIPIVVTFHQPPETLKFELETGAYSGRVAGLMHRLNKGRFNKVAAAIVTSQGQKEVLKKYINEKKIFVIPLGIHLDGSNRIFQHLKDLNNNHSRPYVIVLGNWMRDWELFASVLNIMQIKMPSLNFILVNKKLDEPIRDRLSAYSNLEIKKEVSRQDLLELLYFAELNFMPVKSAAGNNALIEGLSMGCPAIVTVDGVDLLHNEEVVVKYRKNNAFELAQEVVSGVLSENREKIRLACNNYAQQFDWKAIAERTNFVYNSVV